MSDPINPDYYKTAPENTSIHGECIDYATDLGFVLGSAFKYVWRAGRKGDIRQDLNKAVKLLDHAVHNGSFRGQAHLRMDLATPQTPRRRIMLLIAAANSARVAAPSASRSSSGAKACPFSSTVPIGNLTLIGQRSRRRPSGSSATP